MEMLIYVAFLRYTLIAFFFILSVTTLFLKFKFNN